MSNDIGITPIAQSSPTLHLLELELLKMRHVAQNLNIGEHISDYIAHLDAEITAEKQKIEQARSVANT